MIEEKDSPKLLEAFLFMKEVDKTYKDGGYKYILKDLDVQFDLVRVSDKDILTGEEEESPPLVPGSIPKPSPIEELEEDEIPF